jgi:hypothetical protein
VASLRSSKATKEFVALSPSLRDVVYTASSVVSGEKTRMWTTGRECHHGWTLSEKSPPA